ncbi:MAG: adenine phosphoribosyltransferase [Acidimicrobiia bacterium]|nr:adenine phosphoribosyltransferase [Acidimicrobiia bacterium]
MLETKLQSLIRDVPDFPEPGVLFKDITPVLGDPDALAEIIEALAAPYRRDGITKVAGIESRGFILATPVATALGAGFVPLRKPGKLPYDVVREEYSLEYGTDALEMHVDAVGEDDRVLLIDDVIATGGTAAAAAKLLQRPGAHIVGMAVMVELAFLDGRAALNGLPLRTLITYGD